MKRLLCIVLLIMSISVPIGNASDAYKYHGSQLLVLEDSVDTFSKDVSLRHLC